MTPFKIGLTGSIGMGKSTATKMFAAHGVELWDADAAVYRLYSQGGAAVVPVGALCPGAVVNDTIDRAILKQWISEDAGALDALNKVVHPLVRRDREVFLEETTSDIVVLDIPLLFETDGEGDVDLVIVVSIDAETQRRRVLGRGNMTAEQFDLILARQMPDAEKRRRADIVVLSENMADTERQIDRIVASIRREL